MCFLFPEGVSLVDLLVMYHASFTLSLKTVFEDSLYLVHILNIQLRSEVFSNFKYRFHC